jgi:hypothetical protein
MLFLFGIFMIGNAQSYVPFPTENMRWKGSDYHYLIDRKNYDVFIDGDTIIGGVTYHKLIEKSWTHYPQGGLTYKPPVFSQKYVGVFRNDSINKKVYLLAEGWNKEEIWYDFSLNIGDTMVSPFYSNHFKTVVDIDSVEIDGLIRKRLLFDHCDTTFGSNQLYHIEGIGSTYGPLSLYYCPFEDSEFLKCVEQNGSVIYYVFALDSVCSGMNSVESLHTTSQEIRISPNPVKETIRIQFLDPNTRTPQELKIYSITGQLVFQQMINPPESDINIETLESGVYMYSIGDERGKIVVE